MKEAMDVEYLVAELSHSYIKVSEKLHICVNVINVLLSTVHNSARRSQLRSEMLGEHSSEQAARRAYSAREYLLGEQNTEHKKFACSRSKFYGRSDWSVVGMFPAREYRVGSGSKKQKSIRSTIIGDR
uniref:Uncharacterized protein n=1 Tax=Romanomermis culicivorax TaxID=13658 RepID=A0A915I8L9_ROMCU